jgi:hypothetical protein
MANVDEAARLAEALLARALPRRWRHVTSVARRARWVAEQLSLSDDLVSAAWLHDIGYAPGLVDTGFHPIDGARYLRTVAIDEAVVRLVAYHSCAPVEADVRGLGDLLASEFSPGDPALADALLYCDMTTGPDGDYVRPADRLVEIRGRYGPDHQVTRFVELAAPEILATAGRMERLLARSAKVGLCSLVQIALQAAEVTLGGSTAVVRGQRVEGTTKGGRSRVIGIDRETVAALREHHRRQAEERLAAGTAWADI